MRRASARPYFILFISYINIAWYILPWRDLPFRSSCPHPRSWAHLLLVHLWFRVLQLVQWIADCFLQFFLVMFPYIWFHASKLFDLIFNCIFFVAISNEIYFKRKDCCILCKSSNEVYIKFLFSFRFLLLRPWIYIFLCMISVWLL